MRWSDMELSVLCAFLQVGDFLEDASPSDRHLRKIGMHVSAYIAHVRTQLKQTIPKAIVHCLVSPASLLQCEIQVQEYFLQAAE